MSSVTLAKSGFVRCCDGERGEDGIKNTHPPLCFLVPLPYSQPIVSVLIIAWILKLSRKIKNTRYGKL